MSNILPEIRSVEIVQDILIRVLITCAALHLHYVHCVYVILIMVHNTHGACMHIHAHTDTHTYTHTHTHIHAPAEQEALRGRQPIGTYLYGEELHFYGVMVKTGGHVAYACTHTHRFKLYWECTYNNCISGLTNKVKLLQPNPLLQGEHINLISELSPVGFFSVSRILTNFTKIKLFSLTTLTTYN